MQRTPLPPSPPWGRPAQQPKPEPPRTPTPTPTPDAANEQHYEVNAAFYHLALGPRLKYSSGFWPKPDSTFEESEVAMLEMYCDRAKLEDGMKVCLCAPCMTAGLRVLYRV